MKTLPKVSVTTSYEEDACPFCGVAVSKLGTSLLSHVAYNRHRHDGIEYIFMPDNEDGSNDRVIIDSDGDYWIIRYEMRYDDTAQSFAPTTKEKVIAQINEYIGRMKEKIDDAAQLINELEG